MMVTFECSDAGAPPSQTADRKVPTPRVEFSKGSRFQELLSELNAVAALLGKEHDRLFANEGLQSDAGPATQDSIPTHSPASSAWKQRRRSQWHAASGPDTVTAANGGSSKTKLALQPPNTKVTCVQRASHSSTTGDDLDDEAMTLSLPPSSPPSMTPVTMSKQASLQSSTCAAEPAFRSSQGLNSVLKVPNPSATRGSQGSASSHPPSTSPSSASMGSWVAGFLPGRRKKDSLKSLESEVADLPNGNTEIFTLWATWGTVAKKSSKRHTGKKRNNSLNRNSQANAEDSDSDGSGDALVSSMPSHTGDTKISLSHRSDPSTASQSMLSLPEDEGIVTRCFCCCLRLLIIAPQSPCRLAWDFIGCILIYFECIVIPLSFMDLDSPFLAIMAWVTRAFWSCDLPIALFTGYTRPDGLIELRPRRVFKQYVCTWFIFDVLLLAIDWLGALDHQGSTGSVARVSKTAKGIRLIRAVRIMKLLNKNQMPYFVQRALDYYLSCEVSHILFGLAKIIAMVLWICHTLACCWYGLAMQEGNENWVDHYNFQPDTKFHLYTVSFHWALTQFAGAMEVAPQNIYERIYASIVLLICFILAGIVVSSITSSMTRLEIATAVEGKRLSRLRQYLNEHAISARLALRVQRSAKSAIAEQKRRLPESSIELLELISEPLKAELHFEQHMLLLKHHAFFNNCALMNAVTMRRICHKGIQRLTPTRGDVLFESCQESEPTMTFVAEGLVRYTNDNPDIQAANVHNNEWLSEASVWTDWLYCGRAKCKTYCSVLVLNRIEFQNIIAEDDWQINYAQSYGKAFVRRLNEMDEDKLTDLNDSSLDVNWIAQKCLKGELGTEFNKRRGGRMRLQSVPAFSMFHHQDDSVPFASLWDKVTGTMLGGRSRSSVAPAQGIVP